ncbi:MAG: ComF family protein [Burkholderiales bacterium]|nr:ComF family protein [Nitrosomonas sp.]MCP5274326.1 ComF family protein [Burkholderiales bacterium]
MKNLFYKNCILCNALSNQYFCTACHKSIPRLSANQCITCSKIITINQNNKCGACLSTPPAYAATIAALSYSFPVDALIHALKYGMQLAIAPVLAQLFIDKLNSLELSEFPDLVIPMPLHPKRLQERGFNQALEIGHHLTRQLNIVLSSNSCRRIKNTPPQTDLPWKMREKNIQKAFSCNIDLSEKHVAVLDDVMTTGATLNELAKQLRKQGAKKITNWVIARVQSDKFQTQSTTSEI